ncbi:MAG: dihydrolipoamide acetyltransferase family protein [Aminivibrio sp.]|jgi:pyruvate dehydrogenase E2 component (dihydrolipoamide acetyltransferase)
MATPVTMPKLGLTMNAGSVSRWNKKEGDAVVKGEILMTVATDKLTFDVESPGEGVLLKIVVPEGKDVPVGEVLAYLGAAGEVIEAAPAPSETPAEPALRAPAASEGPVPAPAAAPVPVAAGIRATPLARKTAREAGADLAQVQGSGPGGRIVKKDVDAYISGAGRIKASPAARKAAEELGVDLASVSADGRIMKADVHRAASYAAVAAEDRSIPLTPMRKVIAERMSLSKATIPSASYETDADFTALAEFRARVRAEGEERGVKITYNHILMKICAAAIRDVPLANSSFGDEEITIHGNVNIGLAVAVEVGLLVPNVKAVQAKSLLQVADETERLVDMARSGRLSLDDMQGGTFTITNLGMFGTKSFVPIVNPPEACILGLGAIEDRPVVRDGAAAIRSISTLTLVADHRLLDGAEAAMFLARIRELIENPWLLLLQ